MKASRVPLPQVAHGQGAAMPKPNGTAKQKLLDGKQVFSSSMTAGVESYCESAKHYDHEWIEMQPSH